MSIADYFVADINNSYQDGSADSTENAKGFMVINGSCLRIMQFRATPPANNDPGLPGEMCISSITVLGVTTHYLYLCVGSNSWKRISFGLF